MRKRKQGQRFSQQKTRAKYESGQKYGFGQKISAPNF